ncbi:MAG: hypothetical protein Sapg2KO_39020 [Saprospiraceae bacterium]
MKYLCFFALVSLSLVACKDKNTEPEDTGTIIEATYQNATVYTGSTDYSFLTDQAEEIMIRIPNYEEESSIIVPDGLLESSDTLDGPPGINPLVQGKWFKLYYSEAGEVYKISLK